MQRRILIPLALLACALAAVAAAGCGSSGGSETASKPPDYETLLAGSPPPLAALHEQAGELLPGGLPAYEERLQELRGFPVVTNVWASWCGPCRIEFPVLQQLAARYGKRVAFLGVDYEDDAEAAATFLESNPVPYPSYSDPDKEIGDEIGGKGLPRTAYYDRAGELCFLKIGQYADEASFEADVQRFALREECEGS